jgi:LPS export ABC transporter protein LptC
MRAPAELRSGRRRALRRLAGALLGVVVTAVSPAGADEMIGASEVLRRLDAELHVTGMTFVGSRNDVSEFVLRAERAVFRPDGNLATLEDMLVTSTDEVGEHAFDVRCDRGELDVETNDFLAEGDVRGATADGRSYQAPWVRYEHERALLYTDAPVVMQDDTGTFRGDGFRYFVKERRFQLLGNVSLVQTP